MHEDIAHKSPAREVRISARLAPLICASLCVLALSFIFRSAIGAIYQSWQQEEYSYGYLIPLIAVVLIANKLTDVKLAPQNSWLGFVIIAASTGVFFLLTMAGIEGISPQLFVFSLIGAILLFWGARVALPLAAPMAFLLFAVPQPAAIYYNLSVSMRTMSTALGARLLEAVNVPVLREGNIIDLGGFQLQVADACNGLRYLFPLLSLSFLLGYMCKAAFWKRALIFFSALPISIALNGLRIAMIGITVDRWGPQMASGLVHELEGWVIFLGCAALLFAETLALQFVGRKAPIDFDALRLPRLGSVPAPVLGKAALIGISLLVAGVSVSAALPNGLPDFVRPVPLRKPFALFPAQIGPWTGQFNSLDPVSMSVLGTSDYLLADYSKPGSPPVNLYVLYYPRQDSSSNDVIHTPTVCIPSGGWTVVSRAHKTIVLTGAKPLDVNKLIVAKGGDRQMVYYWYNQTGYPTWTAIGSRLRLIRSAIEKRTTNGAMIRVTSGISPGENESFAEARIQAFLRDGLSVVNEHMFKP